MNGDPKMPIVAMGQEYFAEQTRRQELAAAQAQAIEALPEDQKRLYRRAELSIQNVQLAQAAQHAGVVTPTDFAVFQVMGTKGSTRSQKTRFTHEKASSQVSIFSIGWGAMN
jgi:DNA-damage-inducible protein D